MYYLRIFSAFSIIHQIMITIIITMLLLRYTQPCMTKPGEVVVNMMGNILAVQCIVVSFEILIIQAVKFVDVVNYLRE